MEQKVRDISRLSRAQGIVEGMASQMNNNTDIWTMRDKLLMVAALIDSVLNDKSEVPTIEELNKEMLGR